VNGGSHETRRIAPRLLDRGRLCDAYYARLAVFGRRSGCEQCLNTREQDRQYHFDRVHSGERRGIPAEAEHTDEWDQVGE